MAQDKQFMRLEKKIDALLEANGIDPSDYGDGVIKAATRPVKLTAAQQQAIDNAPKHIEAVRTTGQPPAPGAPVTPPAPPKGEEEPDPDDDDDDDGGQLPDNALGNATVPPEAVGQATVVTEQPDGKTTTETKPVSEVKSDQATDDPWPGYSNMSVDQVLAHAKTVDDAARARALAHERKHRKRADVIQPLVNWNS